MNAPRRLPRRDVDGVLLLDKPTAIGSNQALQKVKFFLYAAKAGHTGTLDPMATGLLPLCFGEATKFSSELLDADKRYLATVRLGVTTDSGDADGNVLATRSANCTPADIERGASQFRGVISQVPPMYSALKRDGKPLYEYARAGIELEREARSVVIHELIIRDCTADSFVMDVHCSKGTYIRSLAMDIGEQLGCGAHLVALRRTGIGRLSVDDAHTLSALEKRPREELDTLLLPVDYLLSNVPALVLDADSSYRIGNGQRIRDTRFSAFNGRVRMYSSGNEFLGLGEVTEGSLLHPTRLLARNLVSVV